jgi:hypothetical protein
MITFKKRYINKETKNMPHAKNCDPKNNPTKSYLKKKKKKNFKNKSTGKFFSFIGTATFLSIRVSNLIFFLPQNYSRGRSLNNFCGTKQNKK